jgi:SAM-dependent methyltransferase
MQAHSAPASVRGTLRTPQTAPRRVGQDRDVDETARANRRWWDGEAAAYQAEHGAFLEGFVWGPEGLREDEAGLLGDVYDADVLEVGCGAAQCGRWLAQRGARVVASDLSHGQLRHAVLVPGLSLVQCDAQALPFADGRFDVGFSAYGAVPFVADSALVMREVARVLKPGGRWVFSTSHPIRWAFPDDPGEGGLTVRHSYFSAEPYTEAAEDGGLAYAEHHRTLGQRVREISAAGLVIEEVVEPEWPDGHDQVWGGWSPLRGRLIPGTAIYVTRKP